MTMKSIHIIGTVGLPANYGGWETMVDNIVKDLGEQYSMTVYCSSLHYRDKIKKYYNSNLIYIPMNANGWQSIFYDLASLIIAIFKRADVILILGVSGCIFLPLIKFIYPGLIITNIDGLEWKRGKWGFFAKQFLHISEYLGVKNSNIVIGDNMEIVRYVKRTYNKNAEFIAFGGSIREGIDLDYDKTLVLPEKFALNISRIEPENNIEMIIEACIIAKYPVFIFGKWNANEYSRCLYQKYSTNEFCKLMPHINSQKILNCFRSRARLYLHGHSVGGTNPSLVEAMSWGVPIFAYDVIYNRETTFNEAYYFNSTLQLSSLITEADNLPLEEVSLKMKLFHDNNYNWSEISKRYSDQFNQNI